MNINHVRTRNPREFDRDGLERTPLGRIDHVTKAIPYRLVLYFEFLMELPATLLNVSGAQTH